MTHFIAALFFIAVLLGALVTIHLTVRLYWAEIIAALKGELGLVSAPARPHRLAGAGLRPHAVS